MSARLLIVSLLFCMTVACGGAAEAVTPFQDTSEQSIVHGAPSDGQHGGDGKNGNARGKSPNWTPTPADSAKSEGVPGDLGAYSTENASKGTDGRSGNFKPTAVPGIPSPTPVPTETPVVVPTIAQLPVIPSPTPVPTATPPVVPTIEPVPSLPTVSESLNSNRGLPPEIYADGAKLRDRHLVLTLYGPMVLCPSDPHEENDEYPC